MLTSALNSHEYTLQQFGIVIGHYDRRTILEEVNSLSKPKELEKRIWLVVNYYVTALVKFIRSKNSGQKPDLEVEVYPQFLALYHKAVERPWETKPQETSPEGKALKLIRQAITIKASRLAQKLGVSSKELPSLLSSALEDGWVKRVGAQYHV